MRWSRRCVPGDSQEARLVDAAGRVRRRGAVGIAERGESRRSGSRDIGRAAARRALQADGVGSLARPPLVVELEPEPSMAAGRLPQGPGDWFRSVVPESEIVRVQQSTAGDALALVDGRQLVILARDAHRHAWERDAVEELLPALPTRSSSSSASLTGDRETPAATS